LYPRDDIGDRRRKMFGLGSTKLRIFAVAPSRSNGHDAMSAGGANVVSPVSDHDGIARIGSSQVQRGTNEVGFIARALRPSGPMNGVEVAIDPEVTNDEPGGVD
jgi:hypothetical protein